MQTATTTYPPIYSLLPRLEREQERLTAFIGNLKLLQLVMHDVKGTSLEYDCKVAIKQQRETIGRQKLLIKQIKSVDEKLYQNAAKQDI